MSKNLKSLIAVLFVVSGATGLIYQVVWFKYLGIFLGSTTYAQMIVLSAFLGGLALGNGLAGRVADRLKNPLLVYSVLEFLVGLYCFAYPFLSELAGDVFIAAGRAGNYSDTGGFIFLALRTILAVSLLLLPTMAMGATLPVLSKAFIEDTSSSQRDMASLYGLNSLGAVMGVLYSGFFLIQYFGLDITLYSSAAVNIALGITGAMASQFYVPPARSEEKTTEAGDAIPESATPKRTAWLVVAIAGTSGFAALLYEMVWVRLLIQVFGSSTYAFSIMLMAFISGITIGSFIASSKLIVKWDKLSVVAFSQAAIALSTLPILLLYDRMVYYMWVIASHLQKNDTTFVLFLGSQFFLSFITIVIPTIFMGITLPVIVCIVAGGTNGIGMSVGKVFSVNTAGAVSGAVLTGLIFIPLLGMRGSFELGMFINLAGAAILYAHSPKLEKQKRILYAAVLAACYFGMLFFTPDWNIKLTLASVFRQTNNAAPESFEKFSAMMEKRKALFYKEGTNANVAIVEYPDTVHTKALIINGKADASSGSDMTTQVMLGQIPMMLHSAPKDVFVVGLGSGATVGSVLTHPVSSVDCAEIAREVIEASDFFRRENYACLKDPRLRVYIEDALTYLKLSPKRYDAIISEPSNPWIAGIGNLFSKEYFSLCRSKLQKGGIMVQWFHLYEMDNNIIRLVMNTFASVFPHTQLWNSADGDIIMVGAEKAIRPAAGNLEAKFNNPRVRENFSRISMDNVFTFLSAQMFGTDGFYAISEFPEVNSERHPLLEFRAPRSLFNGKSAGRIFEEDARFRVSGSELLIEEYLKVRDVSEQELNNAMKFHYHQSRLYRLTYSLSRFGLARNPANYTATRYRLYAAEQLPAFKVRTRVIHEFQPAYMNMPEWREILLRDKLEEETLAASFMGRMNIDKLAEELLQVVPAADTVTRLKLLVDLTAAYHKNDEPQRAAEYAEEVQAILSSSKRFAGLINTPEFIYTAALANARVSRFKQSLEYLMGMQFYYPLFEKKSYANRQFERLLRKKGN